MYCVLCTVYSVLNVSYLELLNQFSQFDELARECVLRSILVQVTRGVSEHGGLTGYTREAHRSSTHHLHEQGPGGLFSTFKTWIIISLPNVK